MNRRFADFFQARSVESTIMSGVDTLPILRQVLKEQPRQDQVEALLDIEVVGVRVNRDAPCSNNSGIFEIWPGDETHIHQWFILANGKALAVNEDPVNGPICIVMTYSDH